MQADMRRDVFAHLQKLPVTYFDNNKTGTIMSRIVSDLMDISELAHHGPEDIFISVITIVGAFIMTVLVIYVPFLRNAFDFAHISIKEFAIAILIALTIIPFTEITKAFQRKSLKKKGLAE